MSKYIKIFWFPFVLLLGITTVGICFRPLLPVDETRYISVAWEMFTNHSFFVPLLNGEPYHHKPPLLFWLIDLNWSIFGVNQNIVRFIPSLFALMSLITVHFTAKELWRDDEKSAFYAPLILASMALFAFFSSMLTFDVMLSFWVTLCAYALVLASKRGDLKSWLFVGFAIGGGALTKGPVILVHIISIVVFAKYWRGGFNKKRWYLGFLGAFLIGLFIALLWAIPAAIEGGEAYREAIFWGQSANRVVSSFAHRHPFWWYLPMLLFLFLPWLLFDVVFKRFGHIKKDRGVRFLIVWITGAVFLFSLISGKQIQYLLPEIPAFSLLAARIISLEFKKIDLNSSRYISYVYMFLGVVFLAGVFYLKYFQNRYELSLKPLFFMALFIFGIGFYLKKFTPKFIDRQLKAIGVSIFLFVFALHAGMVDIWKMQDLTPIAHKIKELQNSNKEIAICGKYHGQYHFLGRLKKPLLVVKNDTKTVKDFIKKHPVSIFVYQIKKDICFWGFKPLYRFPYRGKQIVFVKAKDFLNIY